MSADKHGICVGVFVHSSLQTTGQVLLEGSVLNDGDLQGIEEPKHTLALATGDTLDLLNVVDLEASIWATRLLHQQGHENSPLRVRVDATSSTLLKSS